MDEPLLVVGAGAAGAVIAARVTERSASRVRLLESGPDYAPEALPRDLADGRRNAMTSHDFGYRHRPTTVQTLFPLPRGRVVGGSTAVNTCIAVRGHPSDYDEWESRGLRDWSWDQCLPAFARLERDLDFGDAPYHGKDGPLPVRRHPASELRPWSAAFLEACAELGSAPCPDANAPGSEGHGPHAMNKIDGRRISAAEAWLTRAVRARPNFSLEPDTHVRRVLFQGRKVSGVEIERRGAIETVPARKVVLAGGVVGTLGILLRSGVGPRVEIERLGVELVADVPAIGAQLLDHPGTAIVLVPHRWGTSSVDDPLIQVVYRYASDVGPRFRHADMQMQVGNCFPTPWLSVPCVTVMAHVGKPRGHGRIRFPSAHPHARPRVDSLLLDDPQDRAKAVEAMERAGLLVTTKVMRELARCVWPGEHVLARRSRIDAWIRKSCDSGYHLCGTVPMGADDDPRAATDGHGRVRGVEGLLVADGSLMPTVPTGNTNLPTLMIGERFGAWLRDGVV